MQRDDAQYSERVLQAVGAGHKVEAIKLLREETGLGLKEAKDAVERLARSQHSEKARLPDQGGAGAMIKLAIMLLVVSAIFYFLFVA